MVLTFSMQHPHLNRSLSKIFLISPGKNSVLEFLQIICFGTDLNGMRDSLLGKLGKNEIFSKLWNGCLSKQ